MYHKCILLVLVKLPFKDGPRFLNTKYPIATNAK